MESVTSSKVHDKFDAGTGAGDEDQASEQYRRQTRKRMAIIVLSSILLLLIAATAIVGTRVGQGGPNKTAASSPQVMATAAAVKAVCEPTQYPATCVYTVFAANSSGESDPEVLLKITIRAAADALRRVAAAPLSFLTRADAVNLTEQALNSCVELLRNAAGLVERSAEAMAAAGKDGRMLSPEKVSDMQSWLSIALNDQKTCLGGLADAGAGEIRGMMLSAIRNSSELTSNSLVITTNIVPILNKLGLKLHRKLLWVGIQSLFLAPAKIDIAGGSSGDNGQIRNTTGDVGCWWRSLMVPKKINGFG